MRKMVKVETPFIYSSYGEKWEESESISPFQMVVLFS